MMTRRDGLNCLHEPFAECFYFGPERMAERYANGMMEERRLASGFTDATYSSVMEKIQAEYGMVGVSLSFPPCEGPLMTLGEVHDYYSLPPGSLVETVITF